jgi:anti-sigma28 factor (negative regulator of flagellin synthesis)
MKIVDQTNLSPLSAPTTKSASGPDSGKRAEAAPAATGDGNDSAELSGLAGKISQAVSSDSANRATLVDQLRREVAGGTFQVDVAATSHGIVNDSLASAAGAGGGSKK